MINLMEIYIAENQFFIMPSNLTRTVYVGFESNQIND